MRPTKCPQLSAPGHSLHCVGSDDGSEMASSAGADQRAIGAEYRRNWRARAREKTAVLRDRLARQFLADSQRSRQMLEMCALCGRSRANARQIFCRLQLVDYTSPTPWPRHTHHCAACANGVCDIAQSMQHPLCFSTFTKRCRDLWRRLQLCRNIDALPHSSSRDIYTGRAL